MVGEVIFQNDMASSFTNSQMFEILDEGTTTPTIFWTRLTTSSSPTVTSQVSTLFSSY